MSELFNKLKASDDKLKTYSQLMTKLKRKECFLGNAYLQLTPLCNLSCKMCYARMVPSEVEKSGHRILGFTDWKWYIDQFHEIGTSTLNLTGGECMIHPEFEQIYNYAYDSGFEIEIFTNGSTINDTLLNLFKAKPPASFSFTVYGANPETYKRLCGNENAYYSAYRNIELIKNMGFNFLVKYVVTTDNVYDLPTVFDYFKQRGIRLKYQSTLMQFNKADPSTISRMTIDDKCFENMEKLIWGNSYQKDSTNQDLLFIDIMNTRSKLLKKGIRCSAGKSLCYIRWDGMMTPCVSFDSITFDPRTIGVQAAWKKINEWANSYPAIEKCDRCVHLMRCPQCVSLHYNDTGIPGVPSNRLCWKYNHPEEASNIENRLIRNGYISAEKLYGNGNND